jgi:hypothetical protein
MDEDRWVIDAFERQLREGRKSVEELRKRARELREEAAAAEIKGIREACLALADRYEQEAVSRVAA